MAKSVSRGILGKKIGMTQIFDEDGHVVPITVLEAGPCEVIQKKTKDKDGYEAIQIGYEDKKDHKISNPMKGHFKKANTKGKKILREIRMDSTDGIDIGQEIKVDVFKKGDSLDIVGISKGKGFTGVIKHYGFSRGGMSHGSKYHRGPGALGTTDPARVFKGRKLPKRVGNNRVTIKNLKVHDVDVDQNLLLIKGSVPGVRGQYLLVREAN